MPISIEERYKLIFEEHQFASEYRIKIVTGWCAIYAALAVVFAWIHQTIPALSWTVTTIGIAVTLFMWLADYRHRPAIGRSKDVGASIELDANAGIPDEQRFFSKLDKGFSHSTAINIFAGVIILFLFVATVYLICSGGRLPSQ
jgi:hypothetical protein